MRKKLRKIARLLVLAVLMTQVTGCWFGFGIRGEGDGGGGGGYEHRGGGGGEHGGGEHDR